jgi:hypothetical protein
MRKTSTILTTLVFLAMILCGALVWAGQGNVGMTKAEKQDTYLEHLAQEGYRAHLDKDGDVVFKSEGRTYVIIISESDPEFFNMILPNVYSIDSPAERLLALAAADEVNSSSKVVKAFTIRENIWLAVEMFFHSPEDFKGVFHRAKAAMDNGYRTFAAQIFEARRQEPEKQSSEALFTLL